MIQYSRSKKKGSKGRGKKESKGDSWYIARQKKFGPSAGLDKEKREEIGGYW